MKKGWWVGWMVTAGVLLFPALLLASGFALNEHDAKASGMGGAFVAQADNPAAAYYNPAGIVQLEGIQASAGLTFIYPSATFKSDGNDFGGILGTSPGKNTSTVNHTFVVPNAYATYKLNDQWAFGVSGFANYGLVTDWPDSWEGRFIPGGHKVELKTESLSPVVAFRPFKRVSLAFGPVIQRINVELKQSQLLALGIGPGGVTAVEGQSKIDGDDARWGFQAGLMVWILDNLKFGAAFKSAMDYDIDLDLKVRSPTGKGLLKDNGQVEIELPAQAQFGLAYTLGTLTLEADAQWTDWSCFDQLKATFETAPTLQQDKDWHDTWAYRFGIQYSINEMFDVRAGYVYDETPIPTRHLDILVPSGDRSLYSVGSSFHYGAFTADMYYIYLDDENRRFDNESGDFEAGGTVLTRTTGKFKDVDAHLYGFNVSYRF